MKDGYIVTATQEVVDDGNARRAGASDDENLAGQQSVLTKVVGADRLLENISSTLGY